jgi:hypothetical protein
LIPYQLGVRGIEDGLSVKRYTLPSNLHRLYFANNYIHVEASLANLAVPPLLGADCVVAAEAEQLTLPSTLNLCAPTAPVPDSGHDPTVQLRV